MFGSHQSVCLGQQSHHGVWRRWPLFTLSAAGMLMLAMGLSGCSGDEASTDVEQSSNGASNGAASNGASSNGNTDDRLFTDVPACNYRDDPASCEGWICYQDESGTVCERTRTDHPDSRPGWECSDDINPGYTTCWRVGDDNPGGGSGWDCQTDTNGDLVCTNDDPDGSGDPNGWDCEYTDDGTLCTRTDGPGGTIGWDCVDDANGTTCTSDDPSNANDSPGGGSWECVTDNDTRICNDDHDGDEPGEATDNPTGTTGWTCEDGNDGRMCWTDDPGGNGPGNGDPVNGYDTPDGGENWNCEDRAGERICAQDDPDGSGNDGPGSGNDNPGGGGGAWDCEYDDDTNTTICVQDPDTPNEDSDWECYEDPPRRICNYPNPDNPGSDTPNVDECGDPLGNVRGRVCAPSGDFWIVGANVSATYTDCNGKVHTIETQTDAEGYFLLTGIGEGQRDIHVRKGPYERSYRVTITGGQTETIPLGDFCFDQSTAIAVVSGQYDQIERVLDRLGFEYTLFEGYPESNGTRELLGDMSRMNEFDVIFMNCGSTFRGIFDDPRVSAAVESNMMEYVSMGGRLYVSDWDWLFWEAAGPDSFDFHGADASQFEVLQGNSGYRVATVVDPELEAVLGENRVTINFDYPNWAIVDSVPDDVRVFLKADIEVVRGGLLRDVPLLMSHKVGDGEVIFTSYHIHENQAINSIFSYTVLGFE